MYRISFAGAGRVGSSMCMELYSKGFIIEKIFSKTPASGKELADACRADWSAEPAFPGSTDLIIIAVPDNSLIDVIKTIRCSRNTVMVHTAGSYGQDVFPRSVVHKGVFYPLQTFSKGRKINFSELPFFIESSDDFTREMLIKITSAINARLYEAGSEKRRLLHLAAVFASNFTNHMLTIGEELVENAGFEFEVLGPLIRETINKSLMAGPAESQTGPAARNDINTLNKHLDLLSSSPDLQQIYKVISDSIRKQKSR